MSDRTPDLGFESYLRAALADAVVGPAPAALPARAKRRVRVRQGMFSVAAASVMVALLAVAASAFGMFQSDRYIEVAGKQLNERGAGGTYPCDYDEVFNAPTEGPAHCIAYGSYEGLRWGLGVSTDGPPGQEFCMMVKTESAETGGSVGSSCNGFLPGGIGMEVQGPGSYPMMAVGYVPGDTTRLFLERGSNEPMELQLYPAPEDFGVGYISYDVKFYLVWLPDDAETFVAYDGDREIARRPIDGESRGNQPPSERITVTDLEAHGVNYVFDVYADDVGGIDTACTTVTRLRSISKDRQGSCHPGFPDEHALSAAATPLEDGTLVAVHGVVRSNVAKLWTERNDGSRFEVDIIPAPDGIEKRISFFIFQVADAEGIDGSVLLIAEDDQGNRVEVRRLVFDSRL